MAVTVRVKMAEGQELTATVDRDNNWNVTPEGVLAGKPEFVDDLQDILQFEDRLAGLALGY